MERKTESVSYKANLNQFIGRTERFIQISHIITVVKRVIIGHIALQKKTELLCVLDDTYLTDGSDTSSEGYDVSLLQAFCLISKFKG